MSGFCVPLGSNAKSYAAQQRRGLQPVEKIDGETGEIVTGRKKDPAEIRLERYVLQSASRRILKNSKVTRIDKCLRLRHKGADIRVHKSKEHNATSYSGLQTCSSVWSCPVCAAKISERRRVELLAAMDSHKGDGGEVLLLTLTNPHHLGDNLADVLEGQKNALKYFNCSRAAKELNRITGYIGSVRALEVTHGRKRAVNNGWHPHYHILLFVQSGLNLAALRQRYYERWAKSCEKAGLKIPDFEHGVTLENGDKAAKYATKWGLESEMTKGHTKRAKDGETPFDFLRAYVADRSDKQAAALFREFSETFKGKRQLFWSHGLKAQFEIEETTDEELAEQQDDIADVLGIIELDDWALVLKNECRGEVLEIARSGWDAVTRFLVTLRKGVET